MRMIFPSVNAARELRMGCGETLSKTQLVVSKQPAKPVMKRLGSQAKKSGGKVS